MSELRINNITDRAGSSGPIIAGVSTVTSKTHMVMPSGPTEMRGGRGRGVFAGAANPASQNVMDFVEIATTGNATDFGDIIGTNRRDGAGTSSPTRGIFSCGYDGSSFHDEQDAVELVTTGNSVDFGDAANGNRFRCGHGSSGHGGL